MKVLATYSIKGGVGKTTTAVNLADQAATAGNRVLLWDLDPQGAATFFFRVRPRVKGGVERLVGNKGALEPHIRATDQPGLHIIPADFSLRHLDLRLDDHKHPTKRIAALLKPLADSYDVAILDCAPGITLTSESIFAAVDALLVPVVPTTLSQRTLDQLNDFLVDEDDRPLVVPFASMVDRRKKLQRETVAAFRDGRPGFLTTTIPNASIIERMGLERRPLGAYAPNDPATIAYRQLWAEITALIWEPHGHGDRRA